VPSDTVTEAADQIRAHIRHATEIAM